MYPRPGSNRHGFKGQGILSPSCLPIPPLRHLQKIPISLGTLWSGKRDSNSRPRPWQGRALPTELFPQKRSGKRDSNSRPRPWQGRALPTELFPLANCAAKVQLFSIPQAIFRKKIFLCDFPADSASNSQTIQQIYIIE